VIRAWNALSAQMLTEKGKAHGGLAGLAVPVAERPAESKQLVICGLVEDTGFDAVDAGTIAESCASNLELRPTSPELTADQLARPLVSPT